MPIFGLPQGVDADEGAKIPWELQKENIQPLSHGRKMSSLNQSLSGATGGGGPRNDDEITEVLEELDDERSAYQGTDPLGVWVKSVTFLEQNCLTSGKYQTKYDKLLKDCVRRFLNQDQFKNDKRFIEILVKSFSSMSLDKRVGIFVNCVANQGVGKTVSLMYTQIAEDFEALKKFDKASEILRLGKENQAQPAELLEEFSTNFQFRVAERVRQSMEKNDENPEVQDSRVFGASVPVVGPQFEAQNLRTGLVTADPSRARPKLPGNVNEPQRVAIYQETGGEGLGAQSLRKSQEEAAKDMEQNLGDRMNKENLMEPTKWNKPDTLIAVSAPQMAAPPPPAPKIEIYVDNEKSVVEIPIRKLRKSSRTALGERKLDSEDGTSPDNEKSKKNGAMVPAANATAVERPQTQNANIIPGLALPIPLENVEPVPVLPPGQRLMCRIKDLWQDGKEVTFEHIRVAEYKKRKICAMDLLKQTRNVIQTVQGQGRQAEAAPAPKMLPDPRVVELEAENAALKHHIAELEGRQCELERMVANAEQRAKEEVNRQVEMILGAYKHQQPQVQARAPQENQENVFVEPTFPVSTRSMIRPAPYFENSRPLVIEPEPDDTEAIMARQANFQPEFDLSNLTRALNCNPQPIHNSTPEKAVYNDSGRNIQVKPLLIGELTTDGDGGPNGQPSASGQAIPAYTFAKTNFNATMHVGHNLSTIQENSKESRASTTTSSSGSTANYTKSAQKTGGRSQLATSIQSNKSNFHYTPGDWTN